jgi:IS30 family transposase
MFRLGYLAAVVLVTLGFGLTVSHAAPFAFTDRKEQIIRELLEKRVSHSAIARILGVNRGTLTTFVKRHRLETE